MPTDNPRVRTERAIADILAAEGPKAVTVSRVRATARVDQAIAAEIVKDWRANQRVGSQDDALPAVTDGEQRAFESLRATIRKAVLEERAEQDEAINQVAAAASDDADHARQEAEQLRTELEAAQAQSRQHNATLIELQAEKKAADAEIARLREELERQREIASTAREESAEARGKLYVYQQQQETAAKKAEAGTTESQANQKG